MAAFVVMSSNESTPQVSQGLATLMSPLKQPADHTGGKRPTSSPQQAVAKKQTAKRMLPIARLPIAGSGVLQMQLGPQKTLVSPTK